MIFGSAAMCLCRNRDALGSDRRKPIVLTRKISGLPGMTDYGRKRIVSFRARLPQNRRQERSSARGHGGRNLFLYRPSNAHGQCLSADAPSVPGVVRNG